MASEPRNFALIIGAMKSGTTSLFRYLAEHPEIAACHPKEPNFFGNDANWAKGMDWYRSLWKWRPDRHKIALEATSFYTKRPYYPNVPERIAEVKDAEFRFIYIMRHPLERLESHDLQTSLQDDEIPLAEGIPQRPIWASQYAMQLDAYQRFGGDRMLLLFTEELRQDPQSVMTTACRFLGVDPDYEFKSMDVEHNTRQRYYGKVPGWWVRLKRIGLIQNMLRRLPEEKRERLRAHFTRPVELDESRYRLTPEQRELVLEQLRPDLQRLQAEYGVDVESRWGIPLTDRQTRSQS